MSKFLYFGLFLTKSSKQILEKYLTEDENVSNWCKNHKVVKGYLEHCTLFYNSNLNPQTKFDYETLNKLCEKKDDFILLRIVEIGCSDKAMAFKVEILNSFVTCQNKNPHITIFTFDDGKPFDSNKIENWIPVERKMIVTTTLRKVMSN